MKKNMIFLLAALLVCLALNATNVSGSQSGTWTLALSPYYIIGDVTVPAGSDLSIEPGVQIFATGNYQLIAQGTLTAIGTPADSIRFLNGQVSPTALWKGIRLENTSQISNIKHCYIENGTYGVNSILSPANIQYNRFYKNQKGMQIYGIGSANPPAVTVNHNIVEYSIQNGILVSQNTNAVITENEVRYNGTSSAYYGAIQLSNQSAGGSNSPLISNNHIHHNFKQGITAWDVVGASAINPQILNNLIENNLTGIYLLNASGYVADNIIRNNFILGDANSGAGVMVAGATSLPYFERNDIHGNYTGFYLGTNAQPCLGDMSSAHPWAGGENLIYDNIDGSSILHSVFCYSYANSALVIKAENNYWGTNNALLIPNGIQDHTDDPALPTVDFMPFIANLAPSIPQNLTVTASGNDINLDWDNVTTDILGNPITVSFYRVYAGDQPEFDCILENFVGSATQSALGLPGFAETAAKKFFKVTAVAGL